MNFAREGYLYTHIQQGIAILQFTHPASNALTMELLARFEHVLGELSENPAIRVILLTSEGDGAFCAGASLEELTAITNIDQGTAFFNGFARLINAMRSCKKIIITRVQGKAVGGGVGLIAASDYAIATDMAAIKLSELSIGIGPFVIAPAVTRKTGTAAFTELSLTPTTWKNAYWAQQKGLYAQVVNSLKEADKEIEEITTQLAAYSPQALLQLKKISWQGTEHWDTLLPERARISATLALSDFTKEALQRFKK